MSNDPLVKQLRDCVALAALCYEAADMIEKLDAKLSEAIGLALNPCPFEYGTQGYDDWWKDRYERLAQLEGDEM